MQNLWLKIANTASELDKRGFHEEADVLGGVITKVAQYYVNPGIVPMEDRMIPGDEVFPEAEESEQLRLKNIGRYRVPEYSDLPGGDNPEEDKGTNVFNMDGTDNIAGFAQVDEFPSPSMDGNLKNYEYENYRGEGSQPPYTKLMPRG